MADSNGQIKIDLSGWQTMEDLVAWDTAIKSGNISAVNAILASGVVQSWPYAGDPRNQEDYMKLHPQEWGAVIQMVRAQATAFFLGALGINQ